MGFTLGEGEVEARPEIGGGGVWEGVEGADEGRWFGVRAPGREKRQDNPVDAAGSCDLGCLEK